VIAVGFSGLLAIAALVAADSTLMSPAPLRPGEPAPAFKLTTLKGESLTQEALLGKVTLIDFWATWCGPCVATMPDLVRLADALRDKPFRLLSVNVEQENETGVRQFVEERHLNFAVSIDHSGMMQARYDVEQLPMSYVIDKDGTVRHVVTGAVSGKWLEEKIEDLLSE
jgi:thiol-disulfide isomerase/thioredoxin